jgi:hypothetical protein
MDQNFGFSSTPDSTDSGFGSGPEWTDTVTEPLDTNPTKEQQVQPFCQFSFRTKIFRTNFRPNFVYELKNYLQTATYKYKKVRT